MSSCTELGLLTRRLIHGVSSKAKMATSAQHAAAFNKQQVSHRPETVDNNLKFPFYDDLERKFLKMYPDVIHHIINENKGPRKSREDEFNKVLTACMSTKQLGKRYGLLVPRCYQELAGQPAPANTSAGDQDRARLQMADKLGWAVEICRAAGNLMTVDRRYLEAVLMQTSMLSLLDQTLSGETCHLECQQAFIEAVRREAWGVNLNPKLGVCTNPDPLAGYDMVRFKTLCYNTKTYPKFILPVTLSLSLAGISQKMHPHVHNVTNRVLRRIGVYNQVQVDYDKCFTFSNTTDISKGRVTWMIVLARQRGSPSQTKQLGESYGSKDEEDVARVQQIYNDLGLDQQILKYLDSKHHEIEDVIHGIGRRELVPQSLFFKILGGTTGFKEFQKYSINYRK